MKRNAIFGCLMPAIVSIGLVKGDHESVGFDQWKHDRRAIPSSHSRETPTADHLRTRTYPYDSDRTKRPNIILFVTDDQDVELGSLNFMAETGRILREGGAEFRHAYATTPMCCPSRSSMLTGLYVHNHNVYTNNDNCSSIQWQMEHETRSFAAYLNEAGYHTGYFGKYLNRYNGSYIPPGWREWGGLIMNSKYYNYSINHNGKRIRHGDDYSKDYYTDLVANDSVNFLRQWKMWNSDKPVLLVVSFPAPHGPEDSAPQYSDKFFNVTTHHTPSYDYAPNPDKQWILQVTGRMRPIHKHFTDMLMTKRLQTLQSVDSAVRRISEFLKDNGELEDSYLIYTSDHGYHLGQFGLVKGKSFPFEFDVRIPFLVRGPGIEPGSIIHEIALNIDIAPTILDIAGIRVPPHMDGKSLVKLFHRRKKSYRKYLLMWPDTFLIESSGRREFVPLNLYSRISSSATGAVNTINTSAVETEEPIWSSAINASTEAFIALIDESDVPKSSSSLDAAVKEGINENFISNVLLSGKAGRLSLECQQPNYSFPCVVGQKWYCVMKENRWRKHKCRFPSYKNLISSARLHKCTCVTQDGIVYMRFQNIEERFPPKSALGNRKMQDMHPAVIHYLKSNKSADELVNELAKTWKIMKRYRRDSSLERFDVTRDFDVIDGRMFEIPISNNRTNTTTTCIVKYDNTVRCSPEIYRNPILLNVTQKNIVLRIHKLQMHIKKLKNILRHLDKKQSEVLTDNSYSSGNDAKTDDINQNLTNYAWHDETSDSNLSATNFHKHRHQHADLSVDVSSVPNPRSSEFLIKDKRNEKQLNRVVPDTCYCIPHSADEITQAVENMENKPKQKFKDHQFRKKDRKSKRKAKIEKECFQKGMNCFLQDNDHWKTAPFWTEGPFCFCMNSNNNTYTCIRTINITHNFLYCEFITGLVTFYNLRLDPFQQINRFYSLNENEKSWLKGTLSELMKCKGAQECNFRGGFRQSVNINNQHLPKRLLLPDRSYQKRNTTPGVR